MYTPSQLRQSSEQPEESPARKIYSTHAAGRDVRLLPKLLDALDAVLIDVRFAPPVHPIGWNKDYLKLLIKKRYLHVPALGNRGTADKPLIHNLSLGIKIITELGVSILLFCACEDERTCHRHRIAEELVKQGREVIEIADWNELVS